MILKRTDKKKQRMIFLHFFFILKIVGGFPIQIHKKTEQQSSFSIST